VHTHGALPSTLHSPFFMPTTSFWKPIPLSSPAFFQAARSGGGGASERTQAKTVTMTLVCPCCFHATEYCGQLPTLVCFALPYTFS
jgi:hypothetical protein